MTKDPVRHSASTRNLRKALHHADNLIGELEHDLVVHSQEGERLRYKHDAARKLRNRIRSQVEETGK